MLPLSNSIQHQRSRDLIITGSFQGCPLFGLHFNLQPKTLEFAAAFQHNYKTSCRVSLLSFLS